jgi:HSP20 family molecular chaperone IbpA
MSSFYEKLSMKLQGDHPAVDAKGESPTKSVTYSATGERAQPKNEEAPAAPPAAEAAPDGADPIDVDLFQSESRMVVFMQVPGIPLDGFDISISEEANTIVIEATQKRPPLPLAKDAKEGDQPEKGIYVKQEIKWKSLYRKVYLPASFDASDTEAVIDKGILIITLPAKKPGSGKKLTVRENPHDEKKK